MNPYVKNPKKIEFPLSLSAVRIVTFGCINRSGLPLRSGICSLMDDRFRLRKEICPPALRAPDFSSGDA